VTIVCVPTAAERDLLEDVPGGGRVVVWDGTGDPGADVAETEFLVGNYLGGPPSAEALARLGGLRVVQLLSAGVEPWLPVLPDGVVLCNGRGVHGGSTAELAVAGLLSLLRHLPDFAAAQERGEWSPRTADDLDGLRVLVLGAGDIARRIGAALRVFDAEVTYVARTAREDVRTLADLPHLLPSARAVVIALPLTEQTRGLVDAAFLAALPDGAMLVNIARGRIVHTDALVAELRRGRLSAFLDVTDPEPLPAGHPLWTAPNVLITPHVGGGTTGWRRRGYRLVREQLTRYAAGDQLLNVVEGGY
jgi:phosphoglycerate dehydrogenase-like enzyme